MNVIEISDDESDELRDDRSVTIGDDSSLEPVRHHVDLTEDEFILTEEDYLTDAGVERLLQSWRPEEPTPAREANSQTRYVTNEICVNGILYHKGQSVQLPRGRYLRIRSVIQYPGGKIFFKGWQMIKTRRHANSYIPKGGKWENELVWITNENEQEIGLAEVRKIVTIHFTNYCDIVNDPKKGFQGMFCRLKESVGKSGGSLQYISRHEADEGFQWDPVQLRSLWRGETRPFGESDIFTEKFSRPIVDLTDQNDAMSRLRRRRWYTFGDGFCGAGGVSCGANQAGLEIKWAFDASHHATRTYRLNFENAVCELSTIDAFLTNDEPFQRVDISHGSPPCQTFSPAHTINGQNDDANSACIFSCSNLVKSAKPRVHTMEETSGLFDRHQETMHRVILDFSELGYSVRWGILNCANYGAPQARRRLVIIASGPGELLPQFPEPTHGPREFGLKPFITINDVIARIPIGTPDHDIQAASGRGVRRAPYDGNRLTKTITCGGGDNNYHPSGLRRFTHREFACLQTFPLEFRFGLRETLKQIGNAVPPVMAKAIYKEIKQSLQQTDEAEMRHFLKED